ncbi:MAG: hypothetical protein VW577_06385 [Pelagibacteraceae bacterium]
MARRVLPYFKREDVHLDSPTRQKPYWSYRVRIFTNKESRIIASASFQTKDAAYAWIEAFNNGEDLPNTIMEPPEEGKE